MSLFNKVTSLVNTLPDKFYGDRKNKLATRDKHIGDKERIITESSNWSNVPELKLEDNVALADSKAVFLQGSIAYVGNVHFADGIWVGIQLTGPSIGKGNNDGSIKGKRYFPNVGLNNGFIAPIHDVHKRIASWDIRKTEESQLADLRFIDSLVEQRQVAIMKRNMEKHRYTAYDREEEHIRKLKELRLEELRRSRNEDPPTGIMIARGPKLVYGSTKSDLRQSDFELVKGLMMTQQNFCLSDPRLPDNPIVFASQSFLNMTGYSLNDVLGRNCRFLQGPETDPHHVHRIRTAIQQGNDCLVCLINYKADGSKFFNRCFIAALRDEKDRVKNYIGVQCEVSACVALEILLRETEIIASELQNTRLATASLGKYQSNQSDISQWNEESAREEGTHSTWGSEMSLDSPLQATVSEVSHVKRLSNNRRAAIVNSCQKAELISLGKESIEKVNSQISCSDIRHSSSTSEKDEKNSMSCDNSILTVKVGAAKNRKDFPNDLKEGRSSGQQNKKAGIKQKSERKGDKSHTKRKHRKEKEMKSSENRSQNVHVEMLVQPQDDITVVHDN